MIYIRLKFSDATKKKVVPTAVFMVHWRCVVVIPAFLEGKAKTTATDASRSTLSCTMAI